MKYLGAVLLLLALASPRLSRAQDRGVTDCTTISNGLDTTPINPETDPDLPICENERSTAQCCSRAFISRRLGTSEEDFIAGLRAELTDRFAGFENLGNGLRQYLQNVFIPRYFNSLGSFTFLNNGSAVIREFTDDLLEHIDFNPESDDDDDDDDDGEEETDDDGLEDTDVDGFNVGRFLEALVSRLEDTAVDQFAGDSAETGQCIRQFIESNVEQERMEAQADAIQQVRRVLAYIERLRAFARNFSSNLAGFRPLQQCVDTVVRLNTCGRCVASRPLFCRNVCRAIASACYSPFNEALEDQLELLWEVVRRVLRSATDALEELNQNRGLLGVDLTTLVQNLVTTCPGLSFDPTSVIGRRQVDDDSEDDDDEEDSRIPFLPDDTVSRIANSLNGGPFDYEERRLRGPGLCRRILTSQFNCWNGDRTTATDIPEFEGDDIEDQVNNPVIDLDEDALREQADSLGTPISTILNDPSLAQLAPQGLVLPEASGATATLISFSALALVLLAGIFAVA